MRGKILSGMVVLAAVLLFAFEGWAQQKGKMQMKPGMKMEMAAEGVFEGVGKVIALAPEKSKIVVEHEEIQGFMKAMTMGYSVESNALLKGLKPGDAITFKIDAAHKKIIAIAPVKEKASTY